MKKVISYFLLFLFLFNICGFYATYLLLHQENEKEFIAVAQKNNFSTFKKIILSDAEMKDETVFQKKSNSEFIYKGKMYDIVRQNKMSNGICFYCYDDENDSVLNVAFTNHINHFVHPDSKDTTQKNVFSNSFFSKLYCANRFDFTEIFAQKSALKKIFFQPEYQSPEGKVPVPPPKFMWI